jgi:Nitrate/nitrite transporter
MMGGYIFWDIVSPVSTSLKASPLDGGMGWTAAEYGFYAGSYSIFNIFLLMLFFGGVILDKCGIRFTGLLATGIMLLGAVINYLAVSHISPSVYVDLPFTLFGLIPAHLKQQVLVAALGFGLFGMGCDITGITVSKIVTKWFTGHELASAMGVQVAMARLGTASALSFSPLIALQWGISAPILTGAVVLLAGFVLFVGYCLMDKTFDLQTRKPSADVTEEQFSFVDFITVLKNSGFWLIALLCVFFYSSIRPFMKFATDIMVSQYGVAETTAGWIVAAIPYGTIVLTPFFGSLYDRVGHGIRLMAIGCMVLTASHVCLILPLSREPWFALVVMVFIGISFSLVPSALWPSVPKIVPLRQLGTAYSIIYYVQNLGLMLIPMWVGSVAAVHVTDDGRTDYTLPLLIFAMLGALAVTATLLLFAVNRKKGYHLEEANEQQPVTTSIPVSTEEES